MVRVVMRSALLLLALACLGLASCRSSVCRHSVERYEHPCGCTTRPISYLLYKPPGHGAPRPDRGKWPLLVYLPGASTFGHDAASIPDGDPPGEIEKGRDFPMVVLSPMMPRFTEHWPPALVIGLIDHAIEHHDVDPSRVYLSGVCLGGVGVWDTIKAYPDRIAAAVPLCAWGSSRGMRNAASVPVWAFHGGADFVVPLFRQQRLVEAHRACGGSSCFTVYPLGMHWIWSRTYARQDVYDWMLRQRKTR